MNVYDFDGTIYNGDCTLDFYFFVLQRHPALIRYAAYQAWGMGLCAIKVWKKTKAKQAFYTFLKGLSDVDAETELFWAHHLNRIQPWYTAQQQPSDVVISASPRFIVEAACKKIGITHLIASEVNKKTGVYTGENCRGEEKVTRFRQIYGNAAIEGFYSDTLSDTPMARQAKKSYLIKENNITEWRM